MEARSYGEHDRGIESPFFKQKHCWGGYQLMQQNSSYGCYLSESVRLTKNAGAKLPTARGCIEDRSHDQDAHVSPENQHGDSCRNQSLVQQDQEQGAQQKLVGHRIKILPEHGSLFEQARHRSIQRIGQSGCQKQAEAPGKVILQNGCHEKGRQTDAQKREQVGNGAEWV